MGEATPVGASKRAAAIRRLVRDIEDLSDAYEQAAVSGTRRRLPDGASEVVLKAVDKDLSKLCRMEERLIDLYAGSTVYVGMPASMFAEVVYNRMLCHSRDGWLRKLAGIGVKLDVVRLSDELAAHRAGMEVTGNGHLYQAAAAEDRHEGRT